MYYDAGINRNEKTKNDSLSNIELLKAINVKWRFDT